MGHRPNSPSFRMRVRPLQRRRQRTAVHFRHRRAAPAFVRNVVPHSDRSLDDGGGDDNTRRWLRQRGRRLDKIVLQGLATLTFFCWHAPRQARRAALYLPFPLR